MASQGRIERCTCGAQLVVPPLARTVQCKVCGNLTKFRAWSGAASGPRRSFRRWMTSVTSALRPSVSAAAGFVRWTRTAKARTSGLPVSYPQGRGKKRGVLCGVSYKGKDYELKGTVNDVAYMKFMLTSRFGFTEDCILVLTEEEEDPYRIPTKANIQNAMRWLVNGCQRGDSLVFHFSGHGSQKVDDEVSGIDEKDGFDETICPLDYETNGMILDDEINEILVRPIPSGAKLHAIVDACHSGTVLDLPFLCRINRAGYYQWEDNCRSGVYKGTSGGLAICISGCADYQTSADTDVLSRTATGAMTYSFILAIETEPGTTYGRLLSNMRSVIRGANTNTKLTGPIASIVRNVFNSGLTQVPQLSSSDMFDIYKKPFLL